MMAGGDGLTGWSRDGRRRVRKEASQGGFDRKLPYWLSFRFVEVCCRLQSFGF
jgi:hypothetical protein